MNEFVINNKLIENHSFWYTCGTKIYDLALQDYPNDNYFSNLDISVLDLDLFEINRTKGVTNEYCTVDGVIGIALDFQNNKFISSQLLLVELKLNYESTKGFSVENLKKKISHSIDLLGADISINSNYLVVFENNIASKFVSRFDRWIKANELSKNFVAISVDEFQNSLITPFNWPKKSKYKESDIRNDLFVHISNLDFDKFVQQFEFWLELCQKACYVNDQVTCSMISKCLREAIFKIKGLNKLTAEDLLYLEILEEGLYC